MKSISSDAIRDSIIEVIYTIFENKGLTLEGFEQNWTKKVY